MGSPRSQKLAGIVADFRREEAIYRERRAMDNISSDMENILQFLYGKLADALEELNQTPEARRIRGQSR